MRSFLAIVATLTAALFVACGDDEAPANPTTAATNESSALAPSPVAPIGFELVDIWGDDAGEPEFMGPNHMAFGPDGNLYLTEFRGGRLFKLSPEGEVLAQWAGAGEAVGQLGNPTGIHVAPDGSIYIGESGTSRVQKFSAGGESLGTWGERGDAEGQFFSAMGVVVVDDRVYASDFGNGRVQVFTLDGEYLYSIAEEGTEEGQLRQPIGLAYDGSGNLYVVDTGNSRVQKFTLEGEHIATYVVGSGADSAPQVISMDTDGYFYLSNPGLSLVLVFDLDGNRVTALPQESRFSGVHDAAISPDGSKLYAADTGNGQVKVFNVIRN